MGFRPDPQQAAPSNGVGRFRPDAAPVKLGPSPAAVGAEDILGNDRMQELSANPAAPLSGAPPVDTSATSMDRVQAGASGINEGIAGLAGLPMDTLLNIWDIGKAAIGTAQGEITGGPPSDLFDPIDRSGVPLSGQWNAGRLNDIGVDTQAARPDDTASRYLHAAGTGVPGALVGGGGVPNMARQVAAGVTAGVGAEGAADLGADESQQALIANALGIAAGNKASKIPAKGPKAPADPITTEKQQVARDIRSNNIRLTPKEHSKLTGEKNYLGRALQAIAGDTKVSADMAARNQPVINDIGRKAVGASTLTDKGLQPVKDTGNAVYSEMAGLGDVQPTPELSAAIEKARAGAGKSTERNVDIDQFVDGELSRLGGEGPTKITADQIVTRVRELRRDSQNNFKGEGEKRPTVQQEALGTAQRRVADALDDFLELNAATAGKPELAEKYKANRVRLAKVGSVEQATEAGNLNAKQLKDAKKKGAGLTGKLDALATANEYAPQSTAPNANEALLDAPGRNLDILELPVAAVQNVVRHMGVNKILQSDWYQNQLGKGGAQPQYDYDPNPNAFPAASNAAPEPVAPPAPPSVDFAGELGLAPDAGPRDALPGVPTNAGRNLMEQLAAGLGLAEEAPVRGGSPQRTGPQGDIDLAMEDPNGPFKFARGEQFSDARPPAGVQRGAAMDTGDLEILPDAPTGPQDQMPPRPRRLPRQGGAPVEPRPRPAPAAPATPVEAPQDVQDLGALIDQMLNTRNPRAQQIQQPAQQQQASAAPNFAQELGLSLEDAPAFNRSAAPELGADAGGEPLDQRFGMPAPTRVTSGNGYISYIPGGAGVRQITGAFVKAADRGRGAGTSNLMKLVDETAAAGEQLNSDASVSYDQLKVYQKLRDSGKIEFDTDDKAFKAALAGKTPMKGKTPVITNIRPVTKQ